ncbi:MAG: cyclic nucleotide-binding domain-containing protein [Elusimicrobiota bacterium]|jgi:CRP/FNR family transcriptional regulator/CRP/FNR family cyclic AMP-dependent transcriptional regulator
MIKWLKNLFLDPEFSRKREFLKRVSLFHGISRREFGTLFQSLVVRDYHPGEVLCQEGDIGRALFILEQGQVEVVRRGPNDEPLRIALLKGGDYFGEMSLIDEQPRTATVVATEPVRAYLLYKTEIDKLLRQAPHIGAAVMAHLATLLAVRLRAVMSRVPFSLDSTDTAEPKKRIREVL